MLCEFPNPAPRKTRRNLSTPTGAWFRFGPAAGGLVTVTVGGGSPGAVRQHDARLLAGGGVDVVVAEEDLRRCGAGGTVLGHVVGTDVDGGCGGFLDHLDLGGLAVSTAHTVGLTFGSLDDQEDAAVVGKSLVELEGEGVTLAHDGCAGRVLHAEQRGRGGLRRAAAGDNPVVETGEEVGTRDLALGAQDGTGLLREGELVPGEDLVVREGLPHGGQTLEHTLDLGLVGGTDTAAVSAVADILAVLHFGCGHALGAAAHLLEGDGRNVLHS